VSEAANQLLEGRLTGVIPALVTPLDASGRLDPSGLERLLDHVLSAPVAGVSPCGSTGEGSLLPLELRLDLVRAVAARIGALELIPGVAGPSVSQAIADISAYASAGATAVLVPPPWYYPLGPVEVMHFYSALAERAEVPLVLYNIPQMTKVALPPQVVAELADHPNIVGMKDSSRDFEYFQAVVAGASGKAFFVLTGTDTMLAASVAAGGSGTIAASVNVVPALVHDLFEAAVAGRVEEANRLQYRVTQVVNAARSEGFPAGWKAAAEALGLCSRHTAPPMSPASDASVARLKEALANAC